ncbi:MAG: hypothetical protein KDA24_02845 [Deltaproteobacteria bacterium]|nr:hypothetical protein [Deltaproteobacteria bacterium]
MDLIQDFLSKLDHYMGPFTIKQWGLGLLAIGFALQIYTEIRRKLEANAATGSTSHAKCLGCGWRGKISKFHRTCPKCGNIVTRTR